MPRIARIVLPGRPHHVTQRGNTRQAVFRNDDDRRLYLRLLAEQSRLFGLSLLGYCLMGNHVHLVVVPRRADSLALAVGRTHWLFTRAANRRARRSGHLWQNRFFSCPLDEAGLLAVMCYVEQNPVRAGLVRAAWRYPWSSAAVHCGLATGDGRLDLATWGRLRHSRRPWQDVLRRRQAEAEVQAIRQRTHAGRPLASPAKIAELERRLGRPLRPNPVGRPRKPLTTQARK